MISRTKYFILIFIVVIAIMAGCNANSGTEQYENLTENDPAATYCTQNGGEVETRYPYYGTNGPDPLQLAGSIQVCVFTNSEDKTRIFIAVDTLYADQPTLAVTAYQAKSKLTSGGTGGNPSSIYCNQLGGTDAFGGVNAAWGGWAKQNVTDVISMCVFPDLSSIDSWGLTYHSDGTIRGDDLTDLFRYQPGK